VAFKLTKAEDARKSEYESELNQIYGDADDAKSELGEKISDLVTEFNEKVWLRSTRRSRKFAASSRTSRTSGRASSTTSPNAGKKASGARLLKNGFIDTRALKANSRR
jgi:hypothetical protein